MSQKAALITGSAQGIGRAVAQRLLDDGCLVVGLDLSPDGSNPWPEHQCDLSDLSVIPAVFQDIVETLGGAPDYLVNNAGLYEPLAWDVLAAAQFSQTLDLNVSAGFALMRLWAQALIAEKKGGAAVNISSIVAEQGSLNPAYAASKGAVNSLTISMAQSLASHNIRVNAVAPGLVETRILDDVPQERMQFFKSKIALDRLGQPQDIASAVAFLLGDDASYMTGTILPVDGGRL